MTPSLDPQLVFERFVVGSGNRLAATAASLAAESPGRSYNPLVICGPPGLGKTHLLTAIGHRAQRLDPDLLIHFEGLEPLIDRLTASLSAGRVDEFREAIGRMGLLLLDDLQHVSGKARTQEELLRVVELMVRRGGQVVIASDRAPQEIPALDARLATRLAAGLIVDVTSPDEETRGGILRQLVGERGVALDPEVLGVLARLPIDNVRELQGSLHRILAAIEMEQRDVAGADVAGLLGLDEERLEFAADEFHAFVSDISTAVAAVVETAPWRRRLADAILRWEGEGIRTRRLEEALDADSAPDVDEILSGFGRDVIRLRQIQRELSQPPSDPQLLQDPDRLHEAEALLRQGRRAAPPPAAAASSVEPAAAPAEVVDAWFLDREKLAWDWMALEDRIVEEQR